MVKWIVEMVKTKDVFVAGGMPTHTYVDRKSLKLDRKLKTEIREGYKIICVTGPTKSGKTVLCKHVLGSRKSIWVYGGQVKSSDDFWRQLISGLDIPIDETFYDETKSTGGLNALVVAQTDLTLGHQKRFENLNLRRIFKYLREEDIALVVDDFHFLDPVLQKDVVRVLKSEVFDGLSTILIAVPHRAFDAINVEREMEGRFSHVSIPSWEIDDLIRIGEIGFPELGMIVSQADVNGFAVEAFGSPLLMQRFCSRLCDHYDVEGTIYPARNFRPAEQTCDDIFKGVAEQFGLPTFDKLSKGPQARSKRILRRQVNGGNLDIYECLLKAISRTGPLDKIHYNQLRDSLKEFVVEADTPQKHEVSAALGHMSTIAKDEIEGEPVLEWAEDYLYLTDPFLMFYMKWSHR